MIFISQNRFAIIYQWLGGLATIGQWVKVLYSRSESWRPKPQELFQLSLGVA